MVGTARDGGKSSEAGHWNQHESAINPIRVVTPSAGEKLWKGKSHERSGLKQRSVGWCGAGAKRVLQNPVSAVVGWGKPLSYESRPLVSTDMCCREAKSTEAGWTSHWDRSLRDGIQRRTLAGTSERGREARGGWKVVAKSGYWRPWEGPQDSEGRFSRV